jgi:UDP-GlcNAc:undecaprenyl-phosphate/decaprenyl-phosphate GlcNAc-1-phosphate transferase
MDLNLIIILTLINLTIFTLFKKISFFSLVLDRPDNYRKKHKVDTPLAGGQIFFLNLLIIFILAPEELFYEINLINNNYQLILTIIVISGIFFLGLRDDMVEINPNLKLLLLFMMILILLIFDDTLQLKNLRFFFYDNINTGSYAIFFTILCFLLFMNAFNMFDGMNCQSSILTFFILIFFFNKGILSNFFILLAIPLVNIAILNFKGKLFLGDNGTYLISFVFSYLFIKSYNEELIAFSDDIFICMMIPGIDMLRLFIERLLNKKNPFKPDRKHLHHILLNNFGYNKAIIIIFFLFLITFVPLILNVNSTIIIPGYLLIYLTIIFKYKKIN